MLKLLGQLVCYFGVHDFRVIEATMAFGAGGGVAQVECARCGLTTTRSV